MRILKSAKTMVAGLFILAFTLCIGVSHASDLALFVGNPSWYNVGTMQDDAAKIMDTLNGGVLKEVKTFNDDQVKDLEAWAKANMKDGELDIIWLPGSTPDVLYPIPDLKPDGSLAEEWLDNGNMIINLGDWFACLSNEKGVLRRNDAGAAPANILDLPAIIKVTDNLPVIVTETGKKYMPSLKDFIADRALQLGSVIEPWEVAAAFATPSGKEKDLQADPVVIHNTKTDGYFAIITQTLPDHMGDMSRATLTIELIKNWMSGSGLLKSASVNSGGKLATTWAQIKS